MTVQVITQNTGGNVRNAADEVFSGIVDTRINGADPTTNYEADGAVFPLFAVRFGSATDEQKSLIQVDLSNIPAGVTINSATLDLMTEAIGMAAGPVAVYRVLQPAVLTQATWNIYSTGNDWATAGAGSSGTDRASTADDTNAAVDTATGTQETWDITSAVQAALAAEESAVILLLEYSEGSLDTGHGFSNSSDTDGVRPEVVIDYTEGGVAPTWDSARIGPEGGWLTVSASEAVEFGSGGSTGVVIHSTQQGDLTASYRASASTPTAPVFAIPQGFTIGKSDVVTYSYTNPGDGWESTAGADVETFSAAAVTNLSTKAMPANYLSMLRRQNPIIRM